MSPLSFILIIVTIGTLTHLKENTKTYLVKKIEGTPVMSGKGDDPRWQTASSITDFHYPWEAEQAPPTTFKALHDDEWLYCLFDIYDSAFHVEVISNDKTEVAASSRGEIFFKTDDRMNPYYCLEIDPDGRVLDYQASYHRNFNFNWSWPKGHLVIRTDKRSDGYAIEVSISKTSLKQLGLLKNNTLQAGIFRADCKAVPGNDPQFKWISWVRPDARTPDFHIPSSFGLLQLQD